MNPAQTRVQRLTEALGRMSEFRSAVSLHSHTHHSKEAAEFLPLFVQSVPLLNQWVADEMKRYKETMGIAVDFRRVYWTPPVSPRLVLASEKTQIEEELDLEAMVSITDHDSIVAGLSLQGEFAAPPPPISVEWTIPFKGNSFHMGVHHLSPKRAEEIMKDLASYTAEPREGMLGELLERLGRSPETLLVLNHPCCNSVRMEPAKHKSALREFLERYRPWIHALEINGMRPPSENQQVRRMGAEYDFPVVAGGDRHGCAPNTVLNLSRAESWAEFVAEIRRERRSDVLLMPAYDEPVRVREFQTISDIVRHYPRYPYGYRQLTDRVFVDLPGYSWHPLSFYWSGGMPLWLRPLFGVLVALGSDQARPLLRLLLSPFGDGALATLPTEKTRPAGPLSTPQGNLSTLGS